MHRSSGSAIGMLGQAHARSWHQTEHEEGGPRNEEFDGMSSATQSIPHSSLLILLPHSRLLTYAAARRPKSWFPRRCGWRPPCLRAIARARSWAWRALTDPRKPARRAALDLKERLEDPRHLILGNPDAVSLTEIRTGHRRERADRDAAAGRRELDRVADDVSRICRSFSRSASTATSSHGLQINVSFLLSARVVPGAEVTIASRTLTVRRSRAAIGLPQLREHE